MSPDHLPVSRDVFAIWRGMQDWIVETGMLSPLDLSLRLMPSRNWIVRYEASVVPQVDGSIVGSTRRLLMTGYCHHEDLLPAWDSLGIISDYGQRNRGSSDSKSPQFQQNSRGAHRCPRRPVSATKSANERGSTALGDWTRRCRSSGAS